MKCCICGAKVSVAEASRYATAVDQIRVAACCVEHQQEAKSHPEHCKVSYDTTIDLIPL